MSHLFGMIWFFFLAPCSNTQIISSHSSDWWLANKKLRFSKKERICMGFNLRCRETQKDRPFIRWHRSHCAIYIYICVFVCITVFVWSTTSVLKKKQVEQQKLVLQNYLFGELPTALANAGIKRIMKVDKLWRMTWGWRSSAGNYRISQRKNYDSPRYILNRIEQYNRDFFPFSPPLESSMNRVFQHTHIGLFHGTAIPFWSINLCPSNDVHLLTPQLFMIEP